ncbi:hypothetical protein ABT063_40630 [Streptomyces sp. NPDC002838]|uniref:hypothetical protein n=1 Tax=Streptomyces sp. NPDC002838 TaxID=3154436 RepID=UPI003325D025
MNARSTVRALTTAFLAAAAAVAGPAAATATGAVAGERTQAGAIDFTEVQVWATGVNVRNGASGTPAFEQCKSNTGDEHLAHVSDCEY